LLGMPPLMQAKASSPMIGLDPYAENARKLIINSANVLMAPNT